MSYQQQHPNHGQRDHGMNNKRESSPAVDWSAYNLDSPSADLYDTLAENAAGHIASDNTKNKTSQLRGFYDEVITWDQRSKQWDEQQFQAQLPLIKMLNAKVAYAKGRNLVDNNYFSLIRHLLGQVKEKKHLHSLKLFLEAFHGFYKVVRPKD